MRYKIIQHLEMVKELNFDIILDLDGRPSMQVINMLRRFGPRCRGFRYVYSPKPGRGLVFTTISDVFRSAGPRTTQWENLRELELTGDTLLKLLGPYFIKTATDLPNLRRLSITADTYPSITDTGSTLCPSFPHLEELTLLAYNLDEVAWILRSASYPVLELLIVVCQEHLDLHQMKHWKEDGRLQPMPSVRKAVLYGTGEHATSLILGSLPNVEQLAVTSDKKGRIAACLKDPLRWANLSRIAIHNSSQVSLDRVRECLGKRGGSLKAIALNENFAESSKARRVRSWMEEWTRVEVWPEGEFHPTRVLDRMSY